MTIRQDRRTSRLNRQILSWKNRILCVVKKEFFEVGTEQIYMDAVPGKKELVFVTECSLCGGTHEIEKSLIPNHIRKYISEQE